MTYNPNIPNPGDFVSQSQRRILANMSVTNTSFDFDHVSLDNESDINRGKHEKITFAEQGADPTVSADNQSVYTKNNSGQPEIYSRLESDGDVFRWTKNGKLAPGLLLEAYVIFDASGNILKDSNDRELQFNIASITKATPTRDEWVITFTDTLSTAFPFWISNAQYGPAVLEGSIAAVTAPYPFGSYADAITDSMIRLTTKNDNGLSSPANNLAKVITLQIYTVS